jgi:hypothetical protein
MQVLHLTLRWRHDVLAVKRVADEHVPLGSLAPIPGPSSALAFAFARVVRGVPRAFAPDEGVVTVWRQDGSVEIVEGPASIALGNGDVAELVLGDFVASASVGYVEALAGGRRRASALWSVGIAAAAHAIVLGLAAHDARASALGAGDEQVDELRRMLVSAEARDRASEVPPAEDGLGKGEGREQNHERGDGRAAGGERAKGDEGSMGDHLAHAKRTQRYAVPEEVRRDESPSAARADALRDASAFGMIGLLAQGPTVPAAAFADPWAHGPDALAARGAMWSRNIGEAWGDGGLGLTGIGEGGGGDGAGIGLGHVGTLGHGDGPPGPGLGGDGSPMAFSGRSGGWGDIGRLTGTHRSRRYVCWLCHLGVSGRLPAEVIQRIVRQNQGRFRACYEAGLLKNPALAGTVSARFVIGRDGAVATVALGSSSMPDDGVASCVVSAFYGISFPQPEGGIVTVTYPIAFSPG